MKARCAMVCLLAGALGAQPASDDADRKAIADVIEKLNFTAERPALFASGSDVRTELRRLERAGCGRVLPPRVWSEVPSPRFLPPTIHFIAADVALADVDYVQHDSMASSIRTPVVVILKRQGGEWKIVTVRVMEECAGAPRIVPASR